MERALTTVFDAPDIVPDTPDGSLAQHLLSERVFVRLIAFCFATTQGPAYSFSDTFHDFAEAYFSLSLEEGLFRAPVLQGRPVSALVEVLEEAVASGTLRSLTAPLRCTAVAILSSLATLQQQVKGGALSPSDAADLCTTMLFEGLQASPSLQSRSCSDEIVQSLSTTS